MFDQGVIVEGRFLGSFIRGLKQVHAQFDPPFSYAYFCPTCGEVWARCPIEGRPFQIQGGYCRKHPGPSPYTVPGSLMLAWEPAYNDLLLSCPDVVAWEFNRHLDYAERNIL
jgi:hypothetical protein